MCKNCILLLLVFLSVAFQAAAQKFPEHPETARPNTGPAILTHFSVGFQLPAGDMADRFGANGSFGGGAEWITPGNFILGLDGHYIFGGTVKEDPLAILRTPEGDIIGGNQLIADVALRERGYYIGGLIGKLFPMGAHRSGIRVSLGAGMLTHWIRLQDNSSTVVQITGDYAKGYDRRTGGLMLQQFVGWQHLSDNRRSNWMVGLEFGQGFTQSLRSWDFSEMRKLDEKRTDLRFGIRLTWTLPFYMSGAENIYY